MADDVVETNKITDETKKKLRDFDEEEAYFLLCEIFSYAQASKDYAKFQTDLNEWKKRYPVDLFSEALKIKIKYMLSKEFLDTVLKGFIAFDELSKKDSSKGLEKLRKILASAEKHKDGKILDKDLDALYAEYPLNFLKEKYPHVVPQLLSKANRAKILEKFDSSLAFKELKTITDHPEQYGSAQEFTDSIEEWKRLYNTSDFNDKYRTQVEQALTETLDTRHLEELFPATTELDLTQGEVIPIELQDTMQNISKVNKDALYDFFKIVDKNKSDVNGLFNWMCTYSKYINSFNPDTKNAIVTSLMSRYGSEMPPIGTHYSIPVMASDPDKLLSLEDYASINQTKKDALIQLLGILSTGEELTHEDRYQLNVINGNVKKAEIINKSKIEPKLELFMQKFPEDKLTPSDEIYLEPNSDTRVDLTISDEVDLTLHDNDSDNLVIEDENVHDTTPVAFKDTLKVAETLDKVNSSSSTSGSSEGSSASGGSSIAIPSDENENTENQYENIEGDSSIDEPVIDAPILDSIPVYNTSDEIKKPTLRERFHNFFTHAEAGEDRDDL